MALKFGVKKASQDAVATPEEGAPAPSKGKRRLRDNERLRSVVKESTFSAAIDTLQSNEAFRLGPDASGHPQWLALLLDTAAIGGLSEKSKRDEAKGSLVQQIMSNQIEAIATADMLEREFLAFVPTATTLERLGEYSLMTGAPYFWVVFRSVDGELGFNKDIGPATYADALAIQQGRSMQEVMTASATGGVNPWDQVAACVATAGATPGASVGRFGDGGVAGYAGQGEVDEIFGTAEAVDSPAAGGQDDGITETFEAIVEGLEEDEGFYESLAETDELDDFEDDGDLFADDVTGDDFETEVGPYDQDVSDRPFNPYEPRPQVEEFTPEEVRDSIVRRFLSDDLDLAVDLDEFDKIFGRTASPVFSGERLSGIGGSEWLATNLAPMIEAADTELTAMRERHDADLRQTYIDYTSRHLQEVVRQVSLTDTDTRFGGMMALIDADRETARRESTQRVISRRGELEAKFREEAELAGAAAAAQASATYMSMNRGRHELAMAQVERDVEAGVEDRYQTERQQVMDLRRVDAELGLQEGKTVILEALAEDRREQMDAEQALLATWNARILELADQNRKADVVRAEAMAETLARTDALESERTKHRHTLEEVRAGHLAEMTALERRVKEVHEDAKAKLIEQDEAWSGRLQEVERQRNVAIGVSNDLQEQIGSLSTAMREQYEERLASMKATRDAYADEVERGAKATSRLQRTMVLLLIVITVCAVAVGGVMGWSFAQVSATQHAGGGVGSVLETGGAPLD